MREWGNKRLGLTPQQDIATTLALFGVLLPATPTPQDKAWNFWLSREVEGEFRLFDDQPPFEQRWIGSFYRE